ncbi:la-related protein 7 [Hetaerina americana]|uniref:la-related protein 7 n=1 Tax=Hetaerina americana TaxID=62018 RepID=UPI003A7F6174
MEVECSDESKEKESEVKRVRRRRKKAYQAIRQQMEFYFSDANLTKDRFLSKLVEQYPYVDLEIFLKFNKIRALTNSVEELANALSKSEFLSLSEDRTQVARLTPIQRNVCEDECSIYVEGLPPDAKHEWLQEMFSVYGKVVYVSIPKYKHNGKLKGFAFVEFESAEATNKALEAFHAAGCCLPTDMAPEQLCSVATFEPGEGKRQVGIIEQSGNGEEGGGRGDEGCKQEEGGEEKRVEGGVDEGEVGTGVQHTSAENVFPTGKEKRKKRRKRDENDGDTENEEEAEDKRETFESEKNSSPVAKKRKHQREAEEDEEAPDEGVCALQGEGGKGGGSEEEDGGSKERKKRKRRRDDSGGEESVKEVSQVVEEKEGEAAGEAQKKRKRKKGEEEGEVREDETEKKRGRTEGVSVQPESTAEPMEEVKTKRKKRNRNKNEKMEEEPLGLRILSRKDWKRLRNKYLTLQRKNMQMLRAQMMGTGWGGNYWGGECEDHSIEKHRAGEMVKGEETPEAMEKDKASEGKGGKPRVQFVPGVIVKIQFKEPVELARKFKDEVRNLPKSDSVAYIDVKDAAIAAYIRCHTAEAAKDLLKDLPWEDRSILEGGEEKEYWGKILKDRAEKIDKKIRVNQRGRDKILRKAENLMGKHLRYDN